MITLCGLIVFLGALWALAYYKMPRILATVAIAVLLIGFAVLKIWPLALLIPVGLLFLVAAIAVNIPSIRRNYLSAKLFTYFKKVLPPMSETERIALEAGDVWWEGELFQGNPDWQKLLSMPKPQLTAEEQKFLDNETEMLCSLLDDWKIVQEDCDLSPQAWQYIKEKGFLGLVIAKEYGGHGFSALAHSTIVTKIASRSMSAAVSIMVPNSLGPGELLTYYGTEQQKKYFLPRLAKGEEIPCFGLTAPHAGSDATAITDSGIICRGEFKGKEIIGIRLNFSKRYITLAPIATLIGLAFKLYDPEQLVGSEKELGITVCLIPSNYPGVTSGKRHLPLHLAFMNGPVSGKDVFIPLDWIIGGADMRGKGWQMLMECLSIGRGISLPALSTAAAKLAYRSSGAYGLVREQFKTPIGKLEGIQEALAQIGGFAYICEATRIMTASAVDQHIRPALASAITKYHLTELARKVINHAMDIHAGKGIQLGEKNYLGLPYDALPTSITVEGANILTRNLIIFGQGAMRCHPFIRKEIEAAQEADAAVGLQKFDKLIFSHIGYAINNFAKNLFYGLTAGSLIATPTKTFKKHYQQLTRMSTALALTADIAMVVLGGDLKRKERLSARLGDILSYLYLSSAVLRYYENEGQQKQDQIFVSWALQWCLAEIQIAFEGFFANFPNRWLAKLLQGMIFPWGRSYRFPSDELGQQIANEMMTLSALRERLIKFSYVGEDTTEGLCCLENAFQALVAAQPAKVKLQQAIRAGIIPRQASSQERTQAAIKAGILTAEEIQLLHNAASLTEAAIQVDEFDPHYLVREKTYVRNEAKSSYSEKPTA